MASILSSPAEANEQSGAAETISTLGQGEKIPSGVTEDPEKRFGGFRDSPTIHSYVEGVPANSPPRFESGEHVYLGDCIDIYNTDGIKVKAAARKLKLPNGLSVTYGQINALGGDFYSTVEPISDAPNLEAQQERFKQAFAYLGFDTSRQPDEANKILSILNSEIDQVQQAADSHEDSSNVYADLPDNSIELEETTILRPESEPGYLGISLINWDHFGEHAHVAYVAGHSVALQTAYAGNLELAYAYNAFADHYLEDSFSSGHVRTPRKHLHHLFMNWKGFKVPNVYYDLCAKDMHQEENTLGLKVKNKKESWTMYGDKKLLDKDDTKNREICADAVQASADEVYRAYQAGRAQTALQRPDAYAFWELIPDIDAAMTENELVPLFKVDDSGTLLRRKDIFSRHEREYTDDWTAFGTHETIASASESEYH